MLLIISHLLESLPYKPPLGLSDRQTFVDDRAQKLLMDGSSRGSSRTTWLTGTLTPRLLPRFPFCVTLVLTTYVFVFWCTPELCFKFGRKNYSCHVFCSRFNFPDQGILNISESTPSIKKTFVINWIKMKHACIHTVDYFLQYQLFLLYKSVCCLL
jgi:hypothetical protein